MCNKNAMRLPHLNGTVLHSIPFRYIRSKFESRHILPKTLSAVYIVPTMDEDTKLVIVHFSRLSFNRGSERNKKFHMADLMLCLETTSENNEGGFIWFPQFKVDSGCIFNPEACKQLSLHKEYPPKTVDFI